MILSQGAKNMMELAGCEMIGYGKHIPFVAIPTTSGTGSEVTLVAVILNQCKNIKMEFISYYLLPDIAVLDPRMTIKLPPKMTAATGMDALCHAVESYTCMQKNPLSDSYAVAAINLIRENLLSVCENGNTKKGRLALANASLMAGVAFSNSMVGIIHAIGHALGGVSRVPHGEAMTILMPYCMEYNMDKLEKLYAELLLPIAGVEVYSNTPKEERAKRNYYISFHSFYNSSLISKSIPPDSDHCQTDPTKSCCLRSGPPFLRTPGNSQYASLHSSPLP